MSKEDVLPSEEDHMTDGLRALADERSRGGLTEDVSDPNLFRQDVVVLADLVPQDNEESVIRVRGVSEGQDVAVLIGRESRIAISDLTRTPHIRQCISSRHCLILGGMPTSMALPLFP